jgi:type I restriction enzyme, S subunit
MIWMVQLMGGKMRLSMNSDWRWKRLGDCCLKIGSGATPKGGKESYSDDGKCSLIRSQNIYNDGFSASGVVFINEEQAKKLDGVTVESGDILLNITGDSVARVCLAPTEYLPARVNQHVVIIRPNPKVFDNRFIRYFLASPYQQNLMLGLAAAGATRNALTKIMIENFEVPCPPMPVQQAIADILSILDERIILLRKTNVTLEAIAQALFKSWFVDFDPVRAKIESRKSEGVDTETAAFFPDGFKESVLGLIPEGWNVQQIGEVTQVFGGGTPSTKEPAFWDPEEYHWVTPKDLSNISAPVLLNTGRKISAQGLSKVSSGLLPIDTLLMSSRAPIGYLAIAKIPTAINQGFIAIPPHSELSPVFFLLWCQQNMELIKQKANGSTFMEISKSAFRQIPIICPSSSVANAFTEIASVLFEKITENERQAQTLMTLRDILLPRLISGQLRLPEIKERIEDAAS